MSPAGSGQRHPAPRRTRVQPADVPDGYRECARGGLHLVARADQYDALRHALTDATLHEWAAAQPGAQPLQGRATAWATTLPGGTRIVVRHSRHGGALAGITGDLFLAPSRAPWELLASLRLRESGVNTPAVVAYVTYAAMGPLCRADVATEHLDGEDFPAAWRGARDEHQRGAIVGAVGELLRAMQAAGARHPDLNVKNVLIAQSAGSVRAAVLDVDRIAFTRAGDAEAAAANLRRLTRSLQKWRNAGLEFTASHEAHLRAAADA